MIKGSTKKKILTDVKTEIYNNTLMRDFGAGYSDTAWVSSIMLAMLYGTGPRPLLADTSPFPQAQD